MGSDGCEYECGVVVVGVRIVVKLGWGQEGEFHFGEVVIVLVVEKSKELDPCESGIDIGVVWDPQRPPSDRVIETTNRKPCRTQ